MTQDEIISLAREAGLAEWHESIQQHGFKFADINNLELFAALVAAHEREKEIKRVAEGHGWTQAHWTAYEESIVAAEREACAQVCDAEGREWDSDDQISEKNYAAHCAAAIRARGEK